MANPNLAIEQRERNKALYDNVNALYERVHRTFDGVFFEILIEHRTAEVEPPKRFFIHLVDIEGDLQNEHILALHASPALKQRLSRISRLQENYKILMDTALETLAKVKEEYVDAIYKVSLIRRQQEIEFDPVPALEADFETDSEEEYYDDEQDIYSDWDSESDGDWNSDPDSGLDSETDTQSEFELDSDEGTEPDSGMD